MSNSVNLYWSLYIKLAMNFLKKNRFIVVFTTLMTLFLMFIATKSFSQSAFKLMAMTLASQQLLLMSFQESVTNDRPYLLANFNKNTVLLLLFFRCAFVSTALYSLVLLVPVIFGQMSFRFCAIGTLVALALSSIQMMSVKKIAPNKSKRFGSFQVKSEHRVDVVRALNKTYLFRKLNIASVFKVLFWFLMLMGLGLYFMRSNLIFLIFLPLFALTLASLNMNAEVFQNLFLYLNHSLKIGFKSELTFWVKTLSVLGVFFVLMFSLFSDLETLKLILFLPPLFLIQFYVLVIKFNFISSKFLRAVSLGASFVAPVFIPLISFLFFKGKYND